MAQADDTTPGGSRRRLHAALALLPHDPTQVDYLVERLLQADARPSELLVIRQALYDHGHAPNLTPKLRALLEQTPTGLTDSQLRAAGALALFEPKDPGWPTLGPQVAAKLVQQNPLLIGDWREAFQAVAPALTTPSTPARRRSQPARAAGAGLHVPVRVRDENPGRRPAQDQGPGRTNRRGRPGSSSSRSWKCSRRIAPGPSTCWPGNWTS